MFEQNLTQLSIIMPCYNSALYIRESIESFLSQRFKNWELLIIDDCSIDNSAEIIKHYCIKDHRIKYFKTDYPSGSPALPRNIGLENAVGRYIAFLDSDDIWLPDKLIKQFPLFLKESVAIVYSNYEKISNKGIRTHRAICAPTQVNYQKLLNGNVIACSTAMYDTEKTGVVRFQNFGHEDYIFWLSILKKGYIAENTNEVLALYRENINSVSYNKKRAIQWTWHIYRNIEKLSLLSCIYHFINYSTKGLLKFLK